MSMARLLADLYDVPAKKAKVAKPEPGHMPPFNGDTANIPEPKSVGALASVFKSLTSGRSVKSPPATSVLKSAIPAATVQLAEQLNTANGSFERVYGGPADYETLLAQLKADKTIAERITAAESLRLAVDDYSLTGISNIWYAGKDLIDPAKPADLRHAGFHLLTACVRKDASDLERKEYFDTLTAVLNPTDFSLQLESIVELARNGKSLAGFHYDAVPLLTRWLRMAFEVYEHARKPIKSAAGRPGSAKAFSSEERHLHQLFDFVINVIKFSFNVSSDEETSLLIEEILHIAMQARNSAELEACIKVLDAIITFGTIPAGKLRDCVRVLCSIHCLVRDVRKEAWNTFGNLCRSHNGHSTVVILLDILRYPEQGNVREARGSLAVIEKIHGKNGRNGYPIVPHDLLIDAVDMLLAGQAGRVENDVLKLILGIFTTGAEGDSDTIFEQDWNGMLHIAAVCTARMTGHVEAAPTENKFRSLSPAPSTKTTGSQENPLQGASGISQVLHKIIIKIEELLTSTQETHILQKDACIRFFSQVHHHLPDSCAKLVIEHYDEAKACYPSDPDWKSHIQTLLEAFFMNHTRPSTIRLQALKAVTDVYEVVDMMDTDEDSHLVYNFVSGILTDIVEENDAQVLQEVVSFAVAVAENAEMGVFEYIMTQMRRTIHHEHPQSSLSSLNSHAARPGLACHQAPGSEPAHVTTLCNLVTRGVVQVFMRAMDNNAEKAVQSYEEILRIARSFDTETDARISAMKLLFRVRADWADRVYITPFTESDGLAASLYRTAPSLARKQAEDEAAAANSLNRSAKPEKPVEEQSGLASSLSRGIRSLSSTQLNTLSSITKGSVRGVGLTRAMGLNNPTWMTPDPNALPSHVSGRASVLFASWESGEETEANPLPADRRVLRIDAWLDVVITLLQEGCHWEIYAYILVHLAAQLANPGVFKAAIPQVRELRKILCEQINKGSVHEPPLTSGLRKADVAICVFQTLTMLISYHEHFSRPEEDDIVKAFVQGLTGWERSAKCCIHALSICCHELPSSMRSSLYTTLQKMSQIVTQSSVAVHVLEYLACLSRLPDLYSNFREDEYKFVFGICFRFLQSVRERGTDFKPGSTRHSGLQTKHLNSPVETPSTIQESGSGESNFQPNTSDDLPQYVYALAYHVIIFWFLALRLSDRGNQVSWIIKNLVSTNESGRQHMDEQATVTIDFMQRTAYANVDESKANPDFVPEKYGEILKRRWVVGSSIVTIEQAKDNDWAQITKRQPSATSHYMIHERFERPPPHQMLSLAGDSRHVEMNMVLPNYLLLQLGSTLAMSEVSRPVPLPDDDMVRRAIGSFDRIPTVDGHKVGVIYIGEGQTSEVEILANVMGSIDYTTFLEGLGTLTRLQGATFNTQGLDRQYNTDGEYTFCWRDRVTEIVFHVTTLMPTNLDHDAQCIGKKRHIGNDFVNIIFNNSGAPFKFDTFPSEFNYVNIVITPESRASFVARRVRSKVLKEKAFYRIQVMSKPGFPEISPAAETKLISLRALPDFIRLLALNASVFSLVWANRHGGDSVSSWRARLREIARLKEKYGPKLGGAPTSPPSTSNSLASGGDRSKQMESLISSRRASVATFLTGNDHVKAVAPEENVPAKDAGTKESMIETLDFSKWA